MGYNVGLIIRNDALEDISEDKDFGKNVAQAIRRMDNLSTKNEDIRAGNSVNAASVITVNHADVTVLIALGGNHASVLSKVRNGGAHVQEVDRCKLLEQLAKELGYKLTKKS